VPIVWKFWEPESPGALRACPDLYRNWLKVLVKARVEKHLTGKNDPTFVDAWR